MAAAGLPEPRPDHAEADAEFALTMLAALDEVNAAAEVHFDIRIGIHTDPVIVGVIGPRRFLYDIWGDTVNFASRLESHGSLAGSTCRSGPAACCGTATNSWRVI